MSSVPRSGENQSIRAAAEAPMTTTTGRVMENQEEVSHDHENESYYARASNENHPEEHFDGHGANDSDDRGEDDEDEDEDEDGGHDDDDEDDDEEEEVGDQRGPRGSTVNPATLNAYRSLPSISASDLLSGIDMQGIPWPLIATTRESYLEQRHRKYMRYRSTVYSDSEAKEGVFPCIEDADIFGFQQSYLRQKPLIQHFQLLNLIWAPDPTHVYFLKEGGIHCLNTLTLATKPVFAKTHPRYFFQPTTFTVKNNYMVMGGFHGELIAKSVERPGVLFSGRATTHENGITNSLDMVENINGAHQLIVSSNDNSVRLYDLPSMEFVSRFSFDWPVNYSQLSPDRRLICSVGDSEECLVIDALGGEVLTRLTGHKDFSFAAAWSPDGTLLATASQDQTIRIYDTRNFSSPLVILSAKVACFRSLRFSPDSRFLFGAEDIDYVHIFDRETNFWNSQVINVIGDIAGISLTPDGGSLFVGVWDPVFGCIAQYDKKGFSASDLLL